MIMKKTLFILLAVIIAANTMAQVPIRRVGEKYYVGDNRIEQYEYKYLLKNTCPEVFAQYQKSTKIIKSGWSLLGIGVGLTACVAIPVLYSNNPYPKDDGVEICYDEDGNAYLQPIFPSENWNKHMDYYHATLGTFIGLVSAGGVLALTSVPLLAVGYTQRHKTVDAYNVQCGSKEPAITYSLTAGQNGIGFAVNF